MSLFEEAESFGFRLSEADLVIVVLVSHAYLEPGAGVRYVPVNLAPFGVITQYSHPPSLRLNRALRELRRQTVQRLGTARAGA